MENNKNRKQLCFDSPIGKLTITEEAERITGLAFGADADPQFTETTPLLAAAKQQLEEYFEGKRTEFDLPLELKGTDFQKKVWNALLTIPYGQTLSYGQVAAQIGSPKGSRAVGGACNRNPVVILVPCHRVVGASGKMVGFAGGIDIKEQLLAKETK